MAAGLPVNRLLMTVQVLEREPLRHTPAGLPALELLFSHTAEVVEAGLPRRVDLTIGAIALGDLALLLVDTPLGTVLDVEGFLAPVRKDSAKLRMHLQRANAVGGGNDPLVA